MMWWEDFVSEDDKHIVVVIVFDTKTRVNFDKVKKERNSKKNKPKTKTCLWFS